MGKSLLEKSEATNRQISSNTKHNSKQIVEKANEHPEWLPDGWIVDYRTRKSGANMGYGYKCYIDLNGNKFYSKPEVLRYLETIKGNSWTSKEEERCNTNSCTSKKEERCNTNSCTSKKEERCNTNSSTSKKEERCNTMHSPSKDTVEKPTVEDLPPGWIKEVKYRKGGNGNKKDMFYTDPVSGYVFRSKKDVLRYLESGDISTCVLKPNKRQIQDEDKLTPSSAGKKQKLKQSATKRRLFVGKEISDRGSLELPDANSSEKEQDVKVSSDQLTNNVTSEQTLQAPKRSLRKGRTVLDTDLANKSTQQLNGVPESEHSHKMQGDIPQNKSSMLSEGQAVFREQPRQLETGKIEDHKPEQNQYSLSRDSSLPNLKVAMKTIRAELPSPDNPHNSHGLASETRVLKENKLLASEIGQRGEIHSNSNKSSNKKEHWISRRASKRLAGFEPELMSNSISNERAPEYKSKKSKVEVYAALQQSDDGPAVELAGHASVNGESSNKSIKPPKIPPIINNQLEKLEDEELNDEKSEAQQSFAFHYSWSDPNLEFAIKTLTGALQVDDSVGNRPIRIPETDMSPKNKLFENVAGSSSDKIPKVSSSKSKNKKDLKMPMRLSKRLAGHEPEVLPAERALEYAARKLSKDKPTATAVLTNGESGHLHAGEESKLIVHASDRLKTRVCGESSNEGEKSYDVQTVPNEQLQRPEAENIDDDRSEPQFPLPFGDTWSDPCLEFAIKTLTGDLPDADILPVMTPDVNDPPHKELLECVVQKSNEEAHDNAYQPQTNKELNQPSKQLLGQPELRVSSTSCENDLKFAARESYSDEGNITRNLDGGESLHFEDGHVTQIDINTLILEEPLKENEQVLEGESVKEQPQPGTETINHYNSERDFCASFMDSWSDPCLEFAFKTLTGAIPVEENIAIQGCFQEPANRQDQRNGGSTLPEFGSSSISQSDISFHSDIGEKPLPGQQASMSSYSFLTAEKSSLHGYPRVDPQKHYSQCNNNFQRR